MSALAIGFAASSAAGAGEAPVRFAVFGDADLPFSSIVWTAKDWVYVTETTGKFFVADAKSRNVTQFASVATGGEETRCDVSPGKDGFVAGQLYCHLPDDRVVRLARDGSLEVLATLPHSGPSDGAMAFDRGGLFGGALVAATGGSRSNGGVVYVVHGDGRVRRIARYPGPGGADNLIIAPRRFGPVSRWALLAIDNNLLDGRVLAVGPRGGVRILTRRLPSGLAPIAAVSTPRTSRPTGVTRAGLYLADEESRKIYHAPFAALRAQVGAVVVGGELTGDFWTIRPFRTAYRATPLRTNLPKRKWNIEQAVFVP